MAARRESAGPVAAPTPERLGIDWSDQSVRLLVLGVAVVAVLWLACGIIGPSGSLAAPLAPPAPPAAPPDSQKS
jgi:hypothetical protein